MTISHGMHTTFAEMWHSETSSFHLFIGEINITLDDFSCLMRISIRGNYWATKGSVERKSSRGWSPIWGMTQLRPQRRKMPQAVLVQDLVFWKRFIKNTYSGLWMSKVVICRLDTIILMHWGGTYCSWLTCPCLWTNVQPISMRSTFSTSSTWLWFMSTTWSPHVLVYLYSKLGESYFGRQSRWQGVTRCLW